jgi:hypothetical protein
MVFNLKPTNPNQLSSLLGDRTFKSLEDKFTQIENKKTY